MEELAKVIGMELQKTKIELFIECSKTNAAKIYQLAKENPDQWIQFTNRNGLSRTRFRYNENYFLGLYDNIELKEKDYCSIDMNDSNIQYFCRYNTPLKPQHISFWRKLLPSLAHD